MLWYLLYSICLGLNIAWLIWFSVDDDVYFFIRRKGKKNPIDLKSYKDRVFWPTVIFMVSFNIITLMVLSIRAIQSAF